MGRRTFGLIVSLLSMPTLASGSAPGDNTVDASALKKLIADARDAQSDALVVLHGGKVLVEDYFGKERGPIEAMSATKSIVNLAVGILIADGKIKSLDQPVADFFPEWRQGRKRLITVRHLLNHTSGVQNVPNTKVEIYPSPDLVKLALAAELTSDPGAVWAYNNKALNLVAGLVQRASGQRMDLFLKQRLFEPLGIHDITWTLDGAGNPHGMSGLQIRPEDFAKVGQMMLQGGMWNGKRLVAQSWIDESTSHAAQTLQPDCGLLWWLVGGKTTGVVTDSAQLAAMRKAGVDEALVKKLEPLAGKAMKGGEAEFVDLLDRTLGLGGAKLYLSEAASRSFHPIKKSFEHPTGYAAMGYLGQYLVVYPAKKLVAVRMYRGPADEASQPERKTGFESFFRDVEALIRP